MTRLWKQDLRRIKGAPYRLRALEERIQTLRSRAETLTTRLDDVRMNSSFRDVLSAQIAQILDWEEELEKARLELLYSQRSAETEFNALPYPLSEIMIARYVEGLSWSKTAKRVGYSESHCKNLHSKHLKKIKGS